jgi:hypothetical protein
MAAGFKDKQSYIRRGKQYRFGIDMGTLRTYVFERSRGYCEMRVNGILGGRCQRNISLETMELHHEPPKSQGGDDSPEGTLASCRRCHVARHGRIIQSDKRRADVV